MLGRCAWNDARIHISHHGTRLHRLFRVLDTRTPYSTGSHLDRTMTLAGQPNITLKHGLIHIELLDCHYQHVIDLPPAGAQTRSRDSRYKFEFYHHLFFFFSLRSSQIADHGPKYHLRLVCAIAARKSKSFRMS
jgi:hypothetical protein